VDNEFPSRLESYVLSREYKQNCLNKTLEAEVFLTILTDAGERETKELMFGQVEIKTSPTEKAKWWVGIFDCALSERNMFVPGTFCARWQWGHARQGSSGCGCFLLMQVTRWARAVPENMSQVARRGLVSAESSKAIGARDGSATSARERDTNQPLPCQCLGSSL